MQIPLTDGSYYDFTPGNKYMMKIEYLSKGIVEESCEPLLLRDTLDKTTKLPVFESTLCPIGPIKIISVLSELGV